jgi:hypothetical protein
VRFEDIRVADVRARLIVCEVEKDMWGHDVERGHIKGVTFKNITVTADTVPMSTFAGYDAGHLVEDVTFDHLVINGRTIRNPAEGKFSINSFVRNLRFAGAGGK